MRVLLLLCLGAGWLTACPPPTTSPAPPQRGPAAASAPAPATSRSAPGGRLHGRFVRERFEDEGRVVRDEVRILACDPSGDPACRPRVQRTGAGPGLAPLELLSSDPAAGELVVKDPDYAESRIRYRLSPPGDVLVATHSSGEVREPYLRVLDEPAAREHGCLSLAGFPASLPPAFARYPAAPAAGSPPSLIFHASGVVEGSRSSALAMGPWSRDGTTLRWEESFPDSADCAFVAAEGAQNDPGPGPAGASPAVDCRTQAPRATVRCEMRAKGRGTVETRCFLPEWMGGEPVDRPLRQQSESWRPQALCLRPWPR